MFNVQKGFDSFILPNIEAREENNRSQQRTCLDSDTPASCAPLFIMPRRGGRGVYLLSVQYLVLVQRTGTSCCLRTFFVPTTSSVLHTHSSALALNCSLWTSCTLRLRAFACRLSMCWSFQCVEDSKNGREQTIAEFCPLQSFAFCSLATCAFACACFFSLLRKRCRAIRKIYLPVLILVFVAFFRWEKDVAQSTPFGFRD